MGGTALFAAARYGHRDAVALLLHKDANVNLPNNDGDTPLLTACLGGHDRVVRELLQSDADVKQANKNLMTPIVAAAASGSEAVVRCLLISSSSKQQKPSEDDVSSALTLARQSGYISLANLLLNDMRRDRDHPQRESRAPEVANIFASNQQTLYAQQQTKLWLALKKPESWKTSMPPFNRPQAGMLLDKVISGKTAQEYVLPVFGLRIPKAIMALFEMDGVKQLAEELGVRLPTYTISKAVQGKMHKVHTLVAEARKRDDCKSGRNAEAVLRVERFANEFAALSASSITSPEAWDQFVSGHTSPGWMEKLEFSALLPNFGFDDSAAKALQTTRIEDPQDDGTIKMVSLAHWNHHRSVPLTVPARRLAWSYLTAP